MRGRLHRKTAIGLILWQRAVTLRFAAIAVVFSFVAVAFIGCVTSYYQAVREGAAASFGGFTYQVSGAGDQTQAYMRQLQQRGRAVALSSSTASLADGRTGLATTTPVTYLSGAARFGVIQEGRRPAKASEISVSVQVARELDADVGDRVALRDRSDVLGSGQYTLVGITYNPALLGESSSVVQSDDPGLTEQAQVWLTDDNLAPIESELNNGNARIARLDWTTGEMVSQVATRAMSPVSYVELVGAVLVFTAILALFVGHRSIYRHIFWVLTTLGDSPRRAALTVLAGHVVVLMVGGVVGGLVAALTVRASAQRVGLMVDQYWTPISPGALLTCLAAVLGIYVLAGIAALPSLRQRQVALGASSHVTHRAARLIVAAVGIVVTLVFVVLRQLYLYPYGHYAAIVTGAVSVPLLADSLPYFHGRRASRLVSERGSLIRTGALAVVFVVCFYTSLYASFVMTYVNWGRAAADGVNSYFSAQFVTAESVQNLSQRFPNVMAGAVVFADPNESSGQFRVVDPTEADCLRSNSGNLMACNPEVMSQVGMVLPDTPAARLAGSARPDALTQASSATVVVINPNKPEVTRTVELPRLVPSVELRNDLLPGLVILSGSPQAQALGLSESSMRHVFIPNFAGFDDDTKNQFRSAVITGSPFATIVESDSPEFRQLEATAVARSVIATVMSVVILVVLSAIALADQRELRLTITAMGGGTRYRLHLIVPLLVAFSVTVLSAILLGRAAAMDHVPFTPAAVSHNYGIWWMIPVTSLLALAVPVVMATRQAVK